MPRTRTSDKAYRLSQLLSDFGPILVAVTPPGNQQGQLGYGTQTAELRGVIPNSDAPNEGDNENVVEALESGEQNEVDASSSIIILSTPLMSPLQIGKKAPSSIISISDGEENGNQKDRKKRKLSNSRSIISIGVRRHNKQS
ncbi:hypothetical protein AX14_000650 [Amanita brunnescens Koide BX004]|nr:hypothetical protein AX14_000650 [Amanita brunnescens Koide BX004]